MSLLPWGRSVAAGLQPTPAPVPDAEQQAMSHSSPTHPHHLRLSISSALAHIPHSLPEPHVHYPPLHPSYLESSRLMREMTHL